MFFSTIDASETQYQVDGAASPITLRISQLSVAASARSWLSTAYHYLCQERTSVFWLSSGLRSCSAQASNSRWQSLWPSRAAISNAVSPYTWSLSGKTQRSTPPPHVSSVRSSYTHL